MSTTAPVSPEPDDDAAQVVALLVAAGRTLAVAESLTGGAVAARIVAVPGASACLRGGVVTYATDLKTSLLDVPADLLAARGPVDPQVALAMARGVRLRLGAEVGAATTGVAGPDAHGGMPPGTFHIAVVTPDVELVRSAAVGALGRAQVRAAAADAVLALIRATQEGAPQSSPPEQGTPEPPGALVGT